MFSTVNNKYVITGQVLLVGGLLVDLNRLPWGGELGLGLEIGEIHRLAWGDILIRDIHFNRLQPGVVVLG